MLKFLKSSEDSWRLINICNAYFFLIWIWFNGVLLMVIRMEWLLINFITILTLNSRIPSALTRCFSVNLYDGLLRPCGCFSHIAPLLSFAMVERTSLDPKFTLPNTYVAFMQQVVFIFLAQVSQVKWWMETGFKKVMWPATQLFFIVLFMLGLACLMLIGKHELSQEVVSRLDDHLQDKLLNHLRLFLGGFFFSCFI